MVTAIPVLDVFGILPKRRKFEEVLEILKGRIPLVPGESPWGFPIFRPTQGPSTGPASAGFHIRPRAAAGAGSGRRMAPGTFVGPPE